jgi:hypothetical protein
MYSHGIDRHPRFEAHVICPHCNRTIPEQRRYLMSVDPDRPGLIASLRGEGGEQWRVFVTVAVCLLVVLLITGFSALLNG